MKILRFVRNLLYEAVKGLAPVLLVFAVFFGISWCIGLVAGSAGMPAPPGSGVKDMPTLGRGLLIIVALSLVAMIVLWVVDAWRWLRDKWRSS